MVLQRERTNLETTYSQPDFDIGPLQITLPEI